MANNWQVIKPEPDGSFRLANVARADVVRVDVVDVDLLIQTNAGTFLLPRAGIDAMSDRPPLLKLADKDIGSNQLINEIGTQLNDATFLASITAQGSAEQTLNTPASQSEAQVKVIKQQLESAQKEAKELQQQTKELQKEVQEQKEEIERQQKQNDAKGGVDGKEGVVDKLSEVAKKVAENLHTSDYNYQPDPPVSTPSAASVPPGFPAPISLTPIATIFMGNIATTTNSSAAGVTTFLGSGGASNSGATALIGPHASLQFSTTAITGTSGDDVIYASGNVGGNGATASAFYAKEFVVNLAGYFTTINDATISGLPANVTLYVGATALTPDGSGAVTLPAAVIQTQTPFTLVYDATSPSATGQFDVTFTITGQSTRGAEYNSQEIIRFAFMDLTSASQLNDFSLFYSQGGRLKEIYVLPTNDNPNSIDAGAGNNTVVGGRNADTIVAANGDNLIAARDGNDVITLGNGANTVDGGSGDDSIVSGSGNDSILGGIGNDTINAGGGNNTVDGGAGNSLIIVADGNNSITTGTANDTVTTGNGNNTLNDAGGANVITLGAGANNVTIGNGNSTINGGLGGNTLSLGIGSYNVTLGAGNDQVTAVSGGGIFNLGAGANTLTVGAGNYTITTTTGADTIVAGDGNSTLDAGAGNNSITVGNGNNTIITGSGNDSINVGTGSNVVRPGLGTDTITAGGSATMLDYTGLTTALTVNMTAGTVTGTGINTGFTGILNVTGSDVDDSILGGASANVIYGGAGNDTISSGGGADTLYGGLGNDVVTGGVAIDQLYGNEGDDILDGGSGGADSLYGGAGNDSFINPLAGQFYVGSDGTIAVGEQNSVTYAGSATAVQINLTTGIGIGGLAAGSSFTNINRIIGSSGVDTLIGGNLDDYLDAGVGGGLLNGGGGNNTLVGGSTGTTIFQTISTDQTTIIGGLGTDRIEYGANNNVVNFSSSTQTFVFGGVTYTVDANSGTAYTGSNVVSPSSPFASGDSRGDVYQPDSITGAIGIEQVYVNTAGSGTLIFFGRGNEAVVANIFNGNDQFYGGGGNDTVTGFSWNGADRLDGGGGTDLLSEASSSVNSVIYLDASLDINGNGQADRLDHGLNSMTDNGVTYTGFRYNNGSGDPFTTTFAASSTSLIRNFENLTGGVASDLIVGDSNANRLDGGLGNDTIYGAGGADTIVGGAGNDTLVARSTGEMSAATQYDGGVDSDTFRLAGWSFTANSISNAKFVSIETVDVRNNASGQTNQLSFSDIQAFADSGTSSSITLRLDSGDTFTASAGTGAVVQNGNVYRYYSDAGHTVFNTTNLQAEVTVTFG